jgi:hypothetical protein
MTEKKAYTPTEFAALFSREKSWTYRLYYAGKIEGIKDYGRLMIPATEADKIQQDTKRNSGQSLPRVDADTKASAKGSATWIAWIETRRQKHFQSKKTKNNLA